LGAPNQLIGGVYVGDLTNRNAVANPAQPQVIPGGLNTGWGRDGAARPLAGLDL